MTEPLNPTTLFKCLADDTRAKISLLVVVKVSCVFAS